MTLQEDIRFCTSADGVKIASAATGSGPAIVRAGTWLNHLECDARHGEPQAQIRALSRGFTYVRYDSRGCGLSDRHPPSLTFEDGVKDLEAVVASRGLRQFALLGISIGAATSIAYAVRHPEQVTHLILCGGFANSVFSTPGVSPKIIAETELVIQSAELGWNSQRSIFRKLFVAQLLGNPTPAQQLELEERMQLSMTPELAVAYLRHNYSVDVTDLCPLVRTPTLAFHCRQDQMIHFEQGRKLASLIPGARFVALQGQGHILLSTEPATQVFESELRAFMGQSGPAPQLTPRHPHRSRSRAIP